MRKIIGIILIILVLAGFGYIFFYIWDEHSAWSLTKQVMYTIGAFLLTAGLFKLIQHLFLHQHYRARHKYSNYYKK